MAEVFDISELEGSFTERSVVNESTNKETVYKGNYEIKVAKTGLNVADEKSPTPGRKVINLTVQVPKGDKVVTQYVRVSPDVYRKFTMAGQTTSIGESHPDYDKALPLDTQSKLWGHIEKVLNPLGKLSKADVIRELSGTSFNAYILEGFVFDNGTVEFPQGNPSKDLAGYEAARAELIRQGGVPRNYYSSFKAVA